MSGLRVQRSLLLAALVFFFVAPIAADYEQVYKTGVTAFSRKDYKTAIGAMQQAIAERPAESARTVFIYSVWYEPYVPHYYLGMALSEVGRCSEAIKPLGETQRQKVISRKYAANVEKALSRCATAEAPPDKDAGPGVTEPPTSSGGKDPIRTDTGPVTETTGTSVPPVAPQTGSSGPANPPTGPRQDNPRLSAARGSLSSALSRARNVLLSVPRNATPREAALLRTRMRRAESASASLSENEMVAATRDLAVATGDLEMWVRAGDVPGAEPSGPPRELLLAVDAYLRGDYAASLSVLNGAVFSEARSRAQALLFRAAASHALFVIGHGRDKDLSARALSDAREYKKLQRNPAPDGRIFSPAFVRFVQEAGS